jgi:hypothetical protein
MKWIGVELDGTLATFDRWRGVRHIGQPIAPMVERIKQWLAHGAEVRIFTARITGQSKFEALVAVEMIRMWLDKAGLPPLLVTNSTDFEMEELWTTKARDPGSVFDVYKTMSKDNATVVRQ